MFVSGYEFQGLISAKMESLNSWKGVKNESICSEDSGEK